MGHQRNSQDYKTLGNIKIYGDNFYIVAFLRLKQLKETLRLLENHRNPHSQVPVQEDI